MTHLIFVRHGEIKYNLSETYCGQLDCPLSKTGYNQANELMDYILKVNMHIDEIWSSDLQRARSTVAPIAKALSLPVRLHAGLREINCGDFVDNQREYILEKYAELIEKLNNYNYEAHYPNGECLGDVRKRVLAAIREICAKADGKTVLIAAHAGTIHLLIREYYASIGEEKPDNISIWNCSLAHFDYSEKKLTYRKIDEITCKSYGKDQDKVLQKYGTILEI